MLSRSTIFISHGNPEDNEIAGWLAARLTGAGYKVWIDLWHGKGHPTWEEIEEEIRVRAGRVVALVSKTGAIKPGFKDEINAASGAGRHLSDNGFIIPIRLDDISFQSEVPIQLARLNFIDGNTQGWDVILAELLLQLEKDKVERQTIESNVLYDTWLTRRKAANELISLKPERILSNWFEVEAFPGNINFYSSESLYLDWEIAAQALQFPKKYENGILCTFARHQDVRMSLPLGIKVKRIQQLKTNDFLSGAASAPLFSARSDASRAVVDLFRQGFAILAKSRGLEQHALANRLCWYPKYSILKDEHIKFDVDGFSGSRQLLGKYKEFFWHYATSVDLAWTPPIRVTISGHVLFSQNGENILEDAKAAARLRRKAVRSKRNAWWRDVMLSYCAFLSSADGLIEIPMGGNATIRLSSSPMCFTSPRRLEFDADAFGAGDDPFDDNDFDDESDEDDLDEPDDLDAQ